MSTAEPDGAWEGPPAALRELNRPSAETEQLETTTAVRDETVFINAAILGIHAASNAKMVSKPIVVDIELPVWK